MIRKLPHVALAVALLIAVYRVYPRFLPETPEQELVRLQSRREAIEAALTGDGKALYRAEMHFTSVKRRGLRSQALERVRMPIYAIRRRIEEEKEALAVTEQRIAVLKGEPEQDGLR